ncbi:magnesium/cobalt transporter CorA [Scleromatobacter humisilvae]|uniref:Magnesium transport protein CorA n=1 Tax=Scleromatobacter humisilvae TaxID=2897159 RepID=A0A9X2BXN7_9BURK|nr:magnesium/cobalt transporter CorA [Scleromatobacter humisilvae]MCK9684768.1 magnesium/cobalt transporter CorA [Scleromatobacter humisilvae]
MLINCVAYENGTKLADIPVAEISNYLARPGCFVWVALKDATPEEMATMQAEFDLHPLAVEDSLHGHQRPKVEEYGDTLFAVVHTVEMTPTDQITTGEVDIFVGPKFVLSVRNRSNQNLLQVRERSEREPQLLRHGPAFVFYALLDAVVDRYFPIIDRLETELEELEDQMFDPGTSQSNIQRLYELKRESGVVRHAVTPLIDAVHKLFSGRVPTVCENNREYFRDVFDHLLRMNGSLDNLRDTIGTAIQVNLAMVAIEESVVNKRLAAWAGIFAVISAFAGIWGMNFKNMPELEWHYGYPMALATIAIVCVILYRQFKKSGWL